MKSTENSYPFFVLEKKWQKSWEEEKTFKTQNPGDEGFDSNKPKFYALDMFPYPSANGLHVGHPEGYTATDIVARYKRMNGYNVLHPMGWDAFGLPAEQHAIKTGEHPSESTKRNIQTFTNQLKSLGFSYDWEREINTTDPDYVRWTQWIFTKLYGSYFNPKTQRAESVETLEKEGWSKEKIDGVRLAYVGKSPVNWSPDLGTVLANEEVEEWQGKGFQVEKRFLKQWMLRITDYAERLLEDLEGLEWQESMKNLQRNWIGKSEGANLLFDGEDFSIWVFSTRPETIYGATYLVLAPEHDLISKITTPEYKERIEKYQKQSLEKSDLQRTDLNKEKTGVFTGAYASHPFSGKSIPIWISDYVLNTYGTGAVMAVPCHDERDREFSEKFGLPQIQILDEQQALLQNSGKFNGLKIGEARKRIISELKEEGKGGEKVIYKLRDWLFSRQRYWGEPFPIVWEKEQHFCLPEEELPVLAPHLKDYSPSEKPEPLLNKAKKWRNYSDTLKREANTMPQWAGSCWYYLRYCDPKNTKTLVDKKIEEYWLGGKSPGVDLYVGGAEHAVLHLLYARFWHKFLYDLGYVSSPEPFQKLVNQGLILGEDGQKMSKSRGNVISPDEIIASHGADALRLYEMFLGPLEQNKPWKTEGIEGLTRFLSRVWRITMRINQEGEWEFSSGIFEKKTSSKIQEILHQTIKKVSEDIENLRFNTAISQMMILINALTKEKQITEKDWILFLRILSPFAPHIAEELYLQCREQNQSLKNSLICTQDWPKAKESFLMPKKFLYVVQINGKVRGNLETEKEMPQEEIEKLASKLPNVKKFLSSAPKKIIFVPNRLINFVL